MTLRELIYDASELNASAARLTAVSELKKSVPDRETARELFDHLKKDLHPAERTIVAQVLGFHGSVSRSGRSFVRTRTAGRGCDCTQGDDVCASRVRRPDPISESSRWWCGAGGRGECTCKYTEFAGPPARWI